MKPIPKSRGIEGERRVRAMWQGIVDYANADLRSDRHAARNLIQLVVYCFQRLGIGGPHNVLKIVELGRGNLQRQMTIEESFAYFGAHYQPDFRRLLSWLCAPNEHSQLRVGAIEFLQDMIQGFEINIGQPDYVVMPGNKRLSVEQASREIKSKDRLLFILPTLRSCASVMSPIGRFLIDQIVMYQNGEITQSEALPIRLCDKAGCGRFKLPQKQRVKCFCSDRCRSAHYQRTRPAEERNKYMREWRETRKKLSSTQKRVRPQ